MTSTEKIVFESMTAVYRADKSFRSLLALVLTWYTWNVGIGKMEKIESLMNKLYLDSCFIEDEVNKALGEVNEGQKSR